MTGDDQRAKELFRAFASCGFKRDRSKPSCYHYVGPIKANGREISVSMTFRDLEFTHLPELTLLDPAREAPNVVAHLSASGALCFARDHDIVLDRYDVSGTALRCLMLARQGVERALTHKHLEQEIALEFPQHWLGVPFSYDIRKSAYGRAMLYFVPRDSQPSRLLLTDYEDALKRLVPDDKTRREVVSSSRPAFVLRSDNDLTFDHNHRHPKTLAEFLEWLERAVPHMGKCVLQEIARLYPTHISRVFVKAPNGCVGIMLDESTPTIKSAQRRLGLRRIVETQAGKISIERYSGVRVDLDYIFSRNMNEHTALTGRRVALVGCGTIGSHLAKFLVQSGAGHKDGTLLLLDSETLEAGNVGRHYLGPTSIGKSKAEALRLDLLRHFPEANILPRSCDAVSFLDNIAGFDLAIDATGEEALSMSINHHFVTHRQECQEAPDALHVRLFGNGAAAQALLVDGSQFACFKCLKPEHGRDWRFNPLKPGTDAMQTAAACGEAGYIAYGVAAPAMAAAMALQLVLDWNNGTPAPRMGQ